MTDEPNPASMNVNDDLPRDLGPLPAAPPPEQQEPDASEPRPVPLMYPGWEMDFWEKAYCAVLSGYTARPEITVTRAREAAEVCAQIADEALVVYKRKYKELVQ